MIIKTHGIAFKLSRDALISDASQVLNSEKTLTAKQAIAKDGEGLQDHFEPKQPCRFCKHVNIDHDEYPCRECKHNPHVKRDE